MKRDEFVLVKSEDELRPGMCVELRPCQWCGKRDRFMLMSKEPASGLFLDPDGTASPAETKWEFATAGKCDDNGVIAFKYAIPNRRLYRLRDDDTAADETATTRLKERVR